MRCTRNKCFFELFVLVDPEDLGLGEADTGRSHGFKSFSGHLMIARPADPLSPRHVTRITKWIVKIALRSA